jgi:hypothetical protein
MFQDWNGHFDLFILNNGTRLRPLYTPAGIYKAVQHTTKHLCSQNIEKKSRHNYTKKQKTSNKQNEWVQE